MKNRPVSPRCSAPLVAVQFTQFRQHAPMRAAQWDGEFVACLAAERARLQVPKMMRV
jgi:hypothetical protein